MERCQFERLAGFTLYDSFDNDGPFLFPTIRFDIIQKTKVIDS